MKKKYRKNSKGKRFNKTKLPNKGKRKGQRILRQGGRVL